MVVMGQPSIAPQGCRHDCRTTWRYEHGSAMPGGPFAGTMADHGDVRRCEHGHLWVCTGEQLQNRFHCDFDEWERLTWWATPIRYRRAVRALGDIVDAEIACSAEHPVVVGYWCGRSEGHTGPHETTVLRWVE